MDPAVRKVNRSLIRPVTIAAALIGTIEALTWIGLSLVSVLFYHSVILVDDTLPSNSFRRIIYQLFLNADFTNNDVIVTTKAFNIFMYVYVFLSFVWLITSLHILWAMTRNKWSDGFSLIGFWAAITLTVSILDIILMSLIAADFVTVQGIFNPAITAPPTLTTEPTFIPSEITTTTTTTRTTVTLSTAEITDSTTLFTTDSFSTTTDPTDASTTPLSTTVEDTTDVSTTLSTTTEEITDTSWSTTESDTTTYSTTDLSSTSTEPSTTPEDLNIGNQLLVPNINDTIQRLITGDLSLEGFLEIDVDTMKNLVNASYATVISLAARGYILWIVNVVFAVILIKFAYDLKKAATPSLLPIMNAYATGDRSWNNLYEQTEIGTGYSNNGFRDENDREIFPRSDSFVTDREVRNRNPLSNGGFLYPPHSDRSPNYPPNPNVTNGRVAKIGKSGGRRTPPQNIPPPNVPVNPYIPDPDYSPPTSPMPKSVLRPKSNYIL